MGSEEKLDADRKSVDKLWDEDKLDKDKDGNPLLSDEEKDGLVKEESKDTEMTTTATTDHSVEEKELKDTDHLVQPIEAATSYVSTTLEEPVPSEFVNSDNSTDVKIDMSSADGKDGNETKTGDQAGTVAVASQESKPESAGLVGSFAE